MHSPLTAKNTKKAPKSFLKISAGRKTAARAPATEVTSAGAIIRHTPSTLKLPLSRWTLRLKADIGKKAKRLVACAACCSTPRITVRAGIKTVPPPIPIPPSNPAKNPVMA